MTVRDGLAKSCFDVRQNQPISVRSTGTLPPALSRPARTAPAAGVPLRKERPPTTRPMTTDVSKTRAVCSVRNGPGRDGSGASARFDAGEELTGFSRVLLLSDSLSYVTSRPTPHGLFCGHMDTWRILASSVGRSMAPHLIREQ